MPDITLAYLSARAAEVPSNEGSRLERITVFQGDRYTVNFTSASNQYAIWTIPVVPSIWDQADGTVINKLRLNCIATGTTGDVDFEVYYEAHEPSGSYDLDANQNFTLAGNTDNTTLPAQAGYLFSIDINLTMVVDAGDNLRIKLLRDAATDTATATVKVLGCEFLRSATEFNLTDYTLVNLPNAPQVCEGRLTLESGVPVSASDQSAKTTFYFTPYKGNRIAVYDSTLTKFVTVSFTEKSRTTTGLAANTVYDVFARLDSTSILLDTTAWTNDTTRATALTTQDGVLVKSGDLTRRYIGTIRTNGSTQLTDNGANRLVWNYYNRVLRPLTQNTVGTQATYATAGTWRGAGGDTNVRCQVLAGISEECVVLDGSNQWLCASVQAADTAIGEDSTTSPNTAFINSRNHNAGTIVNANICMHTAGKKVVPLGYHYYQLIEKQDLTTTTTWLAGQLRGAWTC